jgi:hypothetical protein
MPFAEGQVDASRLQIPLIAIESLAISGDVNEETCTDVQRPCPLRSCILSPGTNRRHNSDEQGSN